MNADDANQAATGTPIHAASAVTEAYVPVAGVPGSTLIDQYRAVCRMVEEGNATTRQGSEIVDRIAAAHPGSDPGVAESFLKAFADMLQAFRSLMTDADRAYVLFRWRHCPCDRCAVFSDALGHLFFDDGSEREEVFR